MKARTLLGALALVALFLLLWELRWVLLILFGAVVLAVALDVPTTLLRRLTRLNRGAALSLVLLVLLVIGWLLGNLLLPELIDQIRQFSQLVPELVQRLGDMAPRTPCCATWNGSWTMEPSGTGFSPWAANCSAWRVAPPTAPSSCC